MSFQHNLALATSSDASGLPDVAPVDTPLDDNDIFDAVIGMSLADAIREGAEFMPQANGWGDGTTSGCALTVAALAVQNKGYR